MILSLCRVSAFLRCKILYSRESHFCGECSSKTVHFFNLGHTTHNPQPRLATVRRRISQASSALQLYIYFYIYRYIMYNLPIIILLLYNLRGHTSSEIEFRRRQPRWGGRFFDYARPSSVGRRRASVSIRRRWRRRFCWANYRVKKLLARLVR